MDETYPIWEMVSHKMVYDWDGFTTDYSLWHDIENDKWCCIFGDNDWYDPYNSEPDAEFDTEWEAWEWFEDYQSEDGEEEDF